MRNVYAEQLHGIDEDLIATTRLVGQSVNRASHALLTADLHIAEQVIADDVLIDRLRDRIEDRIFEVMSLQQPVAGDLRQLMAAIRMVADLERMGDLAVHIAEVARMRLPEVAVPAALLPTVRRMADVAGEMIGELEPIISDRDVEAVAALEREDEVMDQLRREQFRVLLGERWTHGVEPAIDMALIGRYYERIADHAVALARRVAYLVTGEVTRG